MLKRVVFIVGVMLLVGQSALAHETWIEKKEGQLLVLRGHGGTGEAYDPVHLKEPKAFDTKGQATDVKILKNKENATLSTNSNPAVVAALYDSGYWLKTTDGWKKATKREGKGKYNIVESINSKQWCKGLLAPSTKACEPLGQRFEIVPQTDPTTLRAGDKLGVKVIFDGKPVGGAIVETVEGHKSDQKTPFKTDKNGIASVPIQSAGLHLVKAAHKIPTKDDPDADVLSLSSTMTFVTK